MTKRILITGAEGFIGRALLGRLQENEFLAVDARLDLFDFESILDAVLSDHWDVVIHLAGLSNVPACEKDPAFAYRVNLVGTALLVEAILRHRERPRIVFASTAQVYAPPASDQRGESLRIAEDWPILPQNAYARTKRAAELLIEDAARKHGIRATVLRLFNHSHCSQSPDFFLPHVYSVLTAGGAGSRLAIPVGNLDLCRDIGALSDAVSAIESLLRVDDSVLGNYEVFNICSGTLKHLKLLAEGLAQRLSVEADFRTDPAKVRHGETRSICGNHEKLSRLTGWRPACQTEDELLTSFLSGRGKP